MTKYEELMTQASAQFQRFQSFAQKGRIAISTIMHSFAQYLEAPPRTCRVGPPGMPLDSEKTYHPSELAELRDDGRFAGSIVVSESSPLGSVLRFTFYVTIDEDSYRVQSGDAGPGNAVFLVKQLDAASLAEFFNHVLSEVSEFMRSEPEKIVSGASTRPVGFTDW